MQLRALYKAHGYSQFTTSRFEEYALYAQHKDFLPQGDMITFTGVNGKLMALRPDMTLSIVRSVKNDDGKLTKLYYNENVYRSNGNELKEQMQVGLECIGDVSIKQAGNEVIVLACRSLEILSKMMGSKSEYPRWHLAISHMGFLGGVFNGPCKQGLESLSPAQYQQMLKCMSEKNVSQLNTLCQQYELHDGFREAITELAGIYGPIDDVVVKLQKMNFNDETSAALTELETLRDALQALDISENVYLDFSIVNDITYYNGIIFQGFVEDIPTKVLSGGRYDTLMHKFNKTKDAIGFAVYLDFLSEDKAFSPALNDSQSHDTINIALPKGRLGERAYSILEAAGYGCNEINEDSRKLVFESSDNKVRYFWVKPSDVAIYVQRGVADVGIVGKDILEEQSPDVYELLDMGIGKCRICVATSAGKRTDSFEKTLRVATIFPNIARDYFEKQGRDIDIIKLHGSIEIAPILDLSDVIVDIVETGKTLSENNLEPIETILDISARLITNKVSYKFNYGAIAQLCDNISKTLTEQEGSAK